MMKNNYLRCFRALFVALLLLASSSVSHGATFTTLANGSWDNTTNVWSTDGTNPCFCSPGSYTLGNNIVINHDVTTSSNIHINLGTDVVVSPSGTLSGNHIILLYVANLIFNGDGNLAEIRVLPGGCLHVNSSHLTMSDKLTVWGDVRVYYGQITVNDANIFTMDMSTFFSWFNSKITVNNGYFKNEGEFSLGLSCCLKSEGSIVTDGIMFGSGSVMSTDGGISNFGSWSYDLKYCALGPAYFIPIFQNCVGANADCTNQDMFAQFTYFDVEKQKERVVVNWETISDATSESLAVEKSMNSLDWTQIASYDVTESEKFEMMDYDMDFDIAYYRLKQTDADGQVIYSEIHTVVGIQAKELQVYPNPASASKHNKLFVSTTAHTDIQIVNMFGAIVHEQHDVSESNQIDVSEFTPGVYSVNVIHDNGTVETTRCVIVE